MNSITREQLLSSKNCLTVGDLKRFIEKHDLHDDAIVVVQRVEDRYYDGIDISGMRGTREDGTGGILPAGTKTAGWPVYCKEGMSYRMMLEWNRKIADGTYDDKEQYPLMKDEHKVPFTPEQLEESKEQYTRLHCPVKYTDEGKDILFLDLHY